MALEVLDFDELAGRIEGVSRAILLLGVEMENAGLIDGPRFSGRMRVAIQPSPQSPAHLQIGQRTLLEMADALDQARNHRQEWLDQP